MARRLTDEERTMFEEFMSQFTKCWYCGYRAGRYRSWMIGRLENAHILGGISRVHDRRNIARLCSGCHRLSHGDRIVHPRHGVLGSLTLQNVLWLKKTNDPKFYDRQFLRTLRPKSLPRAKRPRELHL